MPVSGFQLVQDNFSSHFSTVRAYFLLTRTPTSLGQRVNAVLVSSVYQCPVYLFCLLAFRFLFFSAYSSNKFPEILNVWVTQLVCAGNASRWVGEP